MYNESLLFHLFAPIESGHPQKYSFVFLFRTEVFDQSWSISMPCFLTFHSTGSTFKIKQDLVNLFFELNDFPMLALKTKKNIIKSPFVILKLRWKILIKFFAISNWCSAILFSFISCSKIMDVPRFLSLHKWLEKFPICVSHVIKGIKTPHFFSFFKLLLYKEHHYIFRFKKMPQKFFMCSMVKFVPLKYILKSTQTRGWCRLRDDDMKVVLFERQTRVWTVILWGDLI